MEEVNLDKRQALDRFLSGIERRAFRMAEMATGSTEDALDILQDSMLTVAQKYSARPEDEWPPLFYRILQNRISDWHRRQYRKHKLFPWFPRDNSEDDLLEACPQRTGDEPDRKLQQGEAITALELALKKLPLRQQQVVMLRIWEDFGVEQTAAIMQCSEGSVKTHYSRAVHTLREQLGDHWP